MAPSSDVNDTDEDKSKNSIVHEPFHKPSSENIYMDVSESECNIVNETLLGDGAVEEGFSWCDIYYGSCDFNRVVN